MNRISIFDLHILNVDMQDAIELIKNAIIQKTPTNLFFANADCFNIAFEDEEYHDILEKSQCTFGDGVGVRIASKVFGSPIIDNVNGTDMFPLLCDLCLKNNFTMYFLGAKPGIADITKKKTEQKYPGIKIAGCHHGYFKGEDEISRIISNINNSRADILLVALGVPLQEKWIMKYSAQIHAPVKLGVGGLFDFYSDTVARAPLWVRKLALEWLYRLIQEPRRLWRRYLLGNPLFIYRMIKWRLLRKNCSAGEDDCA